MLLVLMARLCKRYITINTQHYFIPYTQQIIMEFSRSLSVAVTSNEKY